MLPSSRAVRVDVHSLWHLGVRLPSNDPPTVVELVAEVVGGYDVQQEDVLGLGVQAGQLELHLGEHLPAETVRGDYWERGGGHIIGLIEA